MMSFLGLIFKGAVSVVCTVLSLLLKRRDCRRDKARQAFLVFRQMFESLLGFLMAVLRHTDGFDLENDHGQRIANGMLCSKLALYVPDLSEMDMVEYELIVGRVIVGRMYELCRLASEIDTLGKDDYRILDIRRLRCLIVQFSDTMEDIVKRFANMIGEKDELLWSLVLSEATR